VTARKPSRGAARARTPDDRLTARILGVCDAVGAFIETWGFRAIHGRAWTLFALSRRPLSQSEAAELLGVSRSMMHLAVAELAEFGLVHPTGPERNAPYEATMDVWPIITDVLRSREWMLMERARLALEAAYNEAEFAEASGETVAFTRDRIGLLLAMTEFAQTALRAIMSLRMPPSMEAFSGWLRRAARTVDQVQHRIPDLLN
jgi:DNA-binding transcriptional regulator GbsR (MarR family)